MKLFDDYYKRKDKDSTDAKAKREFQMRDPSYGYNSTLRRGKGFKDPKERKGLRPIAKAKWDNYKRDRGWVWLVYGDWLEIENWTEFPEAPCPKCGRSMPMSDIALDHIKNRHDFPALVKNPTNWQPLCQPCNMNKFKDDHAERKALRNRDHRGHSLILFMEVRARSDWDQVGNAFYPDEKSGVWERRKSGLVVKTRGDQ